MKRILKYDYETEELDEVGLSTGFILCLKRNIKNNHDILIAKIIK